MREENVESIYELSPVQQGMLFHSLYAPESGVYVVQLSVRMEGKLDVPSFTRAWRQVVDRHAALRTSFHWEELEKPAQVVYRHLEVGIEHDSWCGLSEAEQRRRLDAYLRADRERGFELGVAPLMRLALFSLGERSFQFVWSFHHLLLDGWSHGLVLDEVFSCYAALTERRPVLLARPRPYRHYIAWLQRQDLEAAKSFWHKELAGLDGPTPLGPRPDHSSGGHGHYRQTKCHLGSSTTSAVQALAQRRRLTLNTAVQGTWALLLARYSGLEEVVFGATVAGRPAEISGVGSMVGLFINTLPVRVEVKQDEALMPWLERLQAQQVELRSYEYSPLDQVQKWSGAPAGQPLFEHILVFESYPLDTSLKTSVPELEIVEVRPIEQTNYPLTVLAAPGPQLELGINYDSERFEASMIRRLLAHWRELLQGFAADPERRLSELPLLSAGERQQILSEWNATAEDYPLERTLHEQVEAQVERRPEAVAVVFEGCALSYRELNRRAGQLGRTLRRLAVGPEVPVGVLMERSLELVVALLGILKAGGAYLPLEPSYPWDRLSFMLAQTGSPDGRLPVLLTQERLRQRVPEGRGRVLCVDAKRGPEGSADPGVEVGPDNPAYAIFTSGSTGEPKGSMIPHRGIVNRLLWMQQAYGLEPGEAVLQKTPFGFDVSVWEFFWPLIVGARLVVARPGGHQDSAYLAELIVRERVTTVHFVPSMLELFVDEPRIAECGCLRRVIASGEALPHALRERFFSRLGAELHNLYGPTEASVDVTFQRCERDGSEESIPIGRPIANTGIFVRGRSGDPVPVGVAGELSIAGVGLARGYLARPDLTAERFVPDPFSRQPGRRLYRTGDLARLRPDGAIEFLGRLDHQVKVRGVRIELGEIETVLGGHPAVREAVVIARREETWEGQRLVAYLVADPAPTIGELRGFVKEKLPESMVPAAFVFLDSLPLTPNGKVDRRALPAPDAGRRHLGTAFVAPGNPAEEVLAKIWTEVLGATGPASRQVGVHDSFFELGGDSILSIRVVSMAREAGLRLIPRDLFRYPTIAELAAVATTAPVPQAEQETVKGRVPLVPIQRWFLDRDLSAPHHFNQALLLELGEALDPLRLGMALGALLEHHDALRLRLFRQGSEWRQINVGAEGEVPLTRVDLAALPELGQQVALQEVAAAVQGSLDLSWGPLTRMALIELGPGRAGRLLWVIHHLAVDGVSWRVLLEDLERVYRQRERGEEISLPAKTTSFKRWSERLQEYARSETPAAELGYWLAGGRKRVARLPQDTSGGRNTVDSTRTVAVTLG
ncbi:MAG: amino acid adenylation domain-containing protein, partial [bacterium]|nr:amino acid adenylation domain-containing protein [bacterium]